MNHPSIASSFDVREEHSVKLQEMSCSGRFVRAFARVLAEHSELQRETERLRAVRPDRRIDLEAAYSSVQRWVRATGDVDLGLRAAALSHIGSAGALDYALHTASSIRESMKVASRFAWLYSEGLAPELSVEGEVAFICLRHHGPTPRAILDLTLGIWFKNHLNVQLEGSESIECWFSYEQPADLTAHEQVFGHAPLHFGARREGFSFSAALIDRPLPSSVPLLHAIHVQHLENLSDNSGEPRSTAQRVRKLIERELSNGRLSATSIARSLHMSRRTLVRRLESDGTSFRVELDELRRELALRLVPNPSLSLTEVTRLLGFSQVQGFHRAFKRWTGRTPLDYRDSPLTAAAPPEAGAGADSL